MRYGSVAMLVLALGAAGCGKTADPDPATGETPTAAGSAATAEAAISPSAETTAASTQNAEPASPAASPVTTPIAPANLRALGTEPFWNARIDGKTLTYSTPGPERP